MTIYFFLSKNLKVELPEEFYELDKNDLIRLQFSKEKAAAKYTGLKTQAMRDNEKKQKQKKYSKVCFLFFFFSFFFFLFILFFSFIFL